MTKILSKNIFIILIGFLLFFSFFSFLHANSFSTATTNLINNVTIGKTSLSNTINNVNDNISNFSTNISNIGNFSNTNLFNNVSNFSTAQPSSTQSNGTTQILLENYEGLFSTNMQALQGDPSTALTTYIDLIVKIAFGLGSIAAVALIVLGGIDYIGESFTKKTNGKNKIMRGIGAIVLLAVAFIFFQKVNPETLIVRFKPTQTHTSATLKELEDNSDLRNTAVPYEQQKSIAQHEGYIQSPGFSDKKSCENWVIAGSAQQRYIDDQCAYDTNTKKYYAFFQQRSTYGERWDAPGVPVIFGLGDIVIGPAKALNIPFFTNILISAACLPATALIVPECLEFRRKVMEEGGYMGGFLSCAKIQEITSPDQLPICRIDAQYLSYNRIAKPPRGLLGDLISFASTALTGGLSMDLLKQGIKISGIELGVLGEMALDFVGSLDFKNFEFNTLTIAGAENFAKEYVNQAIKDFSNGTLTDKMEMINSVLKQAAQIDPSGKLAQLSGTISQTIAVTDLVKTMQVDLQNLQDIPPNTPQEEINKLQKNLLNRTLSLVGTVNPSMEQYRALSNEAFAIAQKVKEEGLEMDIDTSLMNNLGGEMLILAENYAETGNVQGINYLVDDVENIHNTAYDETILSSHRFEAITREFLELSGTYNESVANTGKIASLAFDTNRDIDTIHDLVYERNYKDMTIQFINLLEKQPSTTPSKKDVFSSTKHLIDVTFDTKNFVRKFEKKNLETEHQLFINEFNDTISLNNDPAKVQKLKNISQKALAISQTSTNYKDEWREMSIQANNLAEKYKNKDMINQALLILNKSKSIYNKSASQDYIKANEEIYNALVEIKENTSIPPSWATESELNNFLTEENYFVLDNSPQVHVGPNFDWSPYGPPEHRYYHSQTACYNDKEIIDLNDNQKMSVICTRMSGNDPAKAYFSTIMTKKIEEAI